MPLGWQELVIIMIIVLIIFGAGKLPEIGGALGRGIKEFRTATHEDDSEAPAQPGANQSRAVREQPAAFAEPEPARPRVTAEPAGPDVAAEDPATAARDEVATDQEDRRRDSA